MEHPTSPAGAATTGAPRWEVLAELSGEDPHEQAVMVYDDALQWRATWSCDVGAFSLFVDDEPLVDAACPDAGQAYSIDTGTVGVRIEATGVWQATLEQQVDTQLLEPPLDAMDDPQASIVATGVFSGIERSGSGQAHVYRLPDGTTALRLEEFATLASNDLYVWLTDVPDPQSSREVFEGGYWEIAALKSTLGSHNYVVPADVPVDQVRSVVIWCAPVRIAYAAAPLAPPSG